MGKCSYYIVGALRRRYFPYGEITGRILSVMLLSDRPRRSLDFDSLRGAPPYTVCAAELPAQKFCCTNEVLKDTLYYALREPVKAIYVDAPVKVNGKRTQHIHIQYDGIGFIPLDELLKEETA